MTKSDNKTYSHRNWIVVIVDGSGAEVFDDFSEKKYKVQVHITKLSVVIITSSSYVSYT